MFGKWAKFREDGDIQSLGNRDRERERERKKLENVRFEVLAAVLPKSWVLWDITLCHWVNSPTCLERL